MKTLFSAILVLTFIFSCTYKESEQFIPPPPPDSVSYSVDILPILQTSCFGPGYPNADNGPTCHYPPGSYGGVPVFFDQCNNLQMEAKSGKLYLNVLVPNPPMPKFPVPPLPAEDTALIGAWIREGYPCN